MTKKGTKNGEHTTELSGSGGLDGLVRARCRSLPASEMDTDTETGAHELHGGENGPKFGQSASHSSSCAFLVLSRTSGPGIQLIDFFWVMWKGPGGKDADSPTAPEQKNNEGVGKSVNPYCVWRGQKCHILHRDVAQASSPAILRGKVAQASSPAVLQSSS